jgi:uncharacterized protein (TIGR02996 family)
MHAHVDFLEAILAAPDDDVARLVFADWLTEHGEEDYGEFIRVQCELAALGDCQKPGVYHTPDRASGLWRTERGQNCGRCRWCVFTRRERELLDAHRREWTWTVFPKSDGDDRRWLQDRGPVVAVSNRSAAGEAEFRRGFVEGIVCTADRWLAHHHTITHTMPLETVRLLTPIYHLLVGGDAALRTRWPRIHFVLPPNDRSVADEMRARIIEDDVRRFLT